VSVLWVPSLATLKVLANCVTAYQLRLKRRSTISLWQVEGGRVGTQTSTVDSKLNTLCEI